MGLLDSFGYKIVFWYINVGLNEQFLNMTGKGTPIRQVLGKSKMLLGFLEGLPTMLKGEVAMVCFGFCTLQYNLCVRACFFHLCVCLCSKRKKKNEKKRQKLEAQKDIPWTRCTPSLYEKSCVESLFNSTSFVLYFCLIFLFLLLIFWKSFGWRTSKCGKHVNKV